MKEPPYSFEAEQNVLGGLMLDSRAWDDFSDRLSQADFYRAEHRIIYVAICEALGHNKPCDWVTIAEHLRHRGELEEAGGLSYVGSIANDVPSAANVRAYADIVIERSVLRQLIAAGHDISELGFRPEGKSSSALLEIVEQKVFELRRGTRTASGPVPYSDLIARVSDSIDANSKAGRIVTGLETGLLEFDAKTCGLGETDLMILAARPSMGKSAFAGCVADYVAEHTRKKTLVFSMEMSGEQWAMRSLANAADVPLQKLKAGQMAMWEWDRKTAAEKRLRQAAIMVDETGALSPMELRSRARRVAANEDVGLIVVDYVQLMQIPGTKEHRTNEISQISRELKALAKELKIPIIALSQLNRGLEQRDNKRPRMSDLRESGGLEQDADLVVFIYRDVVYNTSTPIPEKAEIIIAKNRNGPLGTVEARFQGEYTRFSNPPSHWDEAPPPAETQEPPRRQRGYLDSMQ